MRGHWSESEKEIGKKTNKAFSTTFNEILREAIVIMIRVYSSQKSSCFSFCSLLKDQVRRQARLSFSQSLSYPSSWIKLGTSSFVEELLLTACCLSSMLLRLFKLLLLDVEVSLTASSHSSGFGCIRINGSSATRSLLNGTKGRKRRIRNR